MERNVILQKLMELDFIAIDMGLHLNIHPEDTDAIAEYRKVIAAARRARKIRSNI